MSALSAAPSTASSPRGLTAPKGTLARINSALGTDLAAKDKALKKFKASREGRDFVAWVTNEHTKCKQARTREVTQWNLNLAMFFGNQNVGVTRDGINAGKLYATPSSKNFEKLIINRVRPLIRTELARLLSQKPAASVIPASSEDQDLMAAMAGEQVWESLYSRRKFHIHFSRSVFWTVTTGTGFMKTIWDDTEKDPHADEPGDITFSSVQPYNLFVPDLLEQEIEAQPYLIEVSIKPVEWLNYIFRNSLEKPVVAEARQAISILEDAYANARTNSNSTPDSAYVYEVWLKPGAHKMLPQGGFVMIVGKEIVGFEPDGMPYDHEEYPYTKFEHVPTSKFYATSVIEDIIGLQREYNRIRSQIADNRRKTGNIQYLAYKGSILPEKVTNEAGQFWLARPGMPLPQQQQPPNMPSYIMENMDRLLGDIEDISGQHQVSKGNVPAGVTAATAISYLQERDDAYLTHTYQSVEQGTERVARQALNLAVQYWELPRLIQVVGADGAFDTNLLKGSDIITGTDIRIEAGSALPQSKAAKQALLMDMMKMGFIKPEDGLKMMEIGGAQKIFEQLRQDERQAQRENIRMKSITPDVLEQHAMQWQESQGSPASQDVNTQQPLDMPPVVPVNSWDNHAVHIEVHNRYRRGQAFELLPPEIKMEFEVHVQQHQLMMAVESGGGLMPPGMGGETEMPPQDGSTDSLSGMMAQEGGDLGGSSGIGPAQ